MPTHWFGDVTGGREEVHLANAWTLLENTINGSPYVRADRDESLSASLVRVGWPADGSVGSIL